MKTSRVAVRILSVVLIPLVVMPTCALPQQTDAAPAAASAKPAFKPEELDQLVAPIALYPDSLLSQILMASTYPLEIVEAQRWADQNKTLKGDALATELEKQTWDPSVKSLINFPQVLTMMNDKLDWTSKLGDAFLGQQKEVMDAVQKLRGKAKDQGNLKTTDQEKVTTQSQTIVIESTSPQVIYVPTYDPTIVYGAWAYPAYPPYNYYPPGYVAGAAVLSFGVGVACGLAWGYAWGGCNWGHGNVEINVHNDININNNHIDYNKYQNNYKKNNLGGSTSWQHDPSHRQGVSYRDQVTAQKFNRGGSMDATRSREDFRGRADSGRQEISRGGADQFKGNQGLNRSSSVGGGDRSSAFGGMDRGSTVKNYSNRGGGSLGGSRASGGFHGRR